MPSKGSDTERTPKRRSIYREESSVDSSVDLFDYQGSSEFGAGQMRRHGSYHEADNQASDISDLDSLNTSDTWKNIPKLSPVNSAHDMLSLNLVDFSPPAKNSVHQQANLGSVRSQNSPKMANNRTLSASQTVQNSSDGKRSRPNSGLQTIKEDTLEDFAGHFPKPELKPNRKLEDFLSATVRSDGSAGSASSGGSPTIYDGVKPRRHSQYSRRVAEEDDDDGGYDAIFTTDVPRLGHRSSDSKFSLNLNGIGNFRTTTPDIGGPGFDRLSDRYDRDTTTPRISGFLNTDSIAWERKENTGNMHPASGNISRTGTFLTGGVGSVENSWEQNASVSDMSADQSMEHSTITSPEHSYENTAASLVSDDINLSSTQNSKTSVPPESKTSVDLHNSWDDEESILKQRSNLISSEQNGLFSPDARQSDGAEKDDSPYSITVNLPKPFGGSKTRGQSRALSGGGINLKTLVSSPRKPSIDTWGRSAGSTRKSLSENDFQQNAQVRFLATMVNSDSNTDLKDSEAIPVISSYSSTEKSSGAITPVKSYSDKVVYKSTSDDFLQPAPLPSVSVPPVHLQSNVVTRKPSQGSMFAMTAIESSFEKVDDEANNVTVLEDGIVDIEEVIDVSVNLPVPKNLDSTIVPDPIAPTTTGEVITPRRSMEAKIVIPSVVINRAKENASPAAPEVREPQPEMVVNNSGANAVLKPTANIGLLGTLKRVLSKEKLVIPPASEEQPATLERKPSFTERILAALPIKALRTLSDEKIVVNSASTEPVSPSVAGIAVPMAASDSTKQLEVTSGIASESPAKKPSMWGKLRSNVVSEPVTPRLSGSQRSLSSLPSNGEESLEDNKGMLHPNDLLFLLKDQPGVLSALIRGNHSDESEKNNKSFNADNSSPVSVTRSIGIVREVVLDTRESDTKKLKDLLQVCKTSGKLVLPSLSEGQIDPRASLNVEIVELDEDKKLLSDMKSSLNFLRTGVRAEKPKSAPKTSLWDELHDRREAITPAMFTIPFPTEDELLNAYNMRNQKVVDVKHKLRETYGRGVGVTPAKDDCIYITDIVPGPGESEEGNSSMYYNTQGVDILNKRFNVFDYFLHLHAEVLHVNGVEHENYLLWKQQQTKKLQGDLWSRVMNTLSGRPKYVSGFHRSTGVLHAGLLERLSRGTGIWLSCYGVLRCFITLVGVCRYSITVQLELYDSTIETTYGTFGHRLKFLLEVYSAEFEVHTSCVLPPRQARDHSIISDSDNDSDSSETSNKEYSESASPSKLVISGGDKKLNALIGRMPTDTERIQATAGKTRPQARYGPNSENFEHLGDVSVQHIARGDSRSNSCVFQNVTTLAESSARGRVFDVNYVDQQWVDRPAQTTFKSLKSLLLGKNRSNLAKYIGNLTKTCSLRAPTSFDRYMWVSWLGLEYALVGNQIDALAMSLQM